jgi:hypothetical protein
VFLKVLWGSRGGCGHALQRGESTFSEGATQEGGARTGVEHICCSLDGWKQLRRQATVPELAWTLPEMRKRPSFGEFLHHQICVRRATLEPGGSQSLCTTLTDHGQIGILAAVSRGSGPQYAEYTQISATLVTQSRSSEAVIRWSHALSATIHHDGAVCPCSSTRTDRLAPGPPSSHPGKTIRLDLVRTHLAVSPRSGHEP